MDLDAFLNLAERLTGDARASDALPLDLADPPLGVGPAIRGLSGFPAASKKPRGRSLAERFAKPSLPIADARLIDRIRIVGAVGSETLWAERFDDGTHRIVSVPFVSADISLGDIVVTVVGPEGEPPLLDYVVNESNYSTIVVVLVANALQAQLRLPAALGKIAELAVAFEQVKEVVSFAVSCENMDEACSLLEAAENEGILRFSVMSERLPYKTPASGI